MIKRSFRILAVSVLVGSFLSFLEVNKSLWGLDISHFQEVSNWKGFEINKPDFIFLKATEGVTHKDSKYLEYKKHFLDMRVPVGAYHFLSYQTDGTQQAKEYLNFSKLRSGDLLPVLDCEYKTKMPSKAIVRDRILSFSKEVKDQLGVYPIIYSECEFYEEFLKDFITFKPLRWVSNYDSLPGCDFTIWQKSNSFSHPAFKGRVDYNELGNEIELKEILLK